MTDDEPRPLGADPDRRRPEPGGRAKSRTPASQLASHFEQVWDRTLAENPELRSTHPLRPWGAGKDRIVMLSWLKGTFLDAVGDVEQGKAVIEVFCERVATGDRRWAYRPDPAAGKVWSLWRHLPPRLEAARQLLESSGPEPDLIPDNVVELRPNRGPSPAEIWIQSHDGLARRAVDPGSADMAYSGELCWVDSKYMLDWSLDPWHSPAAFDDIQREHRRWLRRNPATTTGDGSK